MKKINNLCRRQYLKMKNEVVNMLLAFGICDNKKQAQNFIQNKSDEDIRQLYLSLIKHRQYLFYND